MTCAAASNPTTCPAQVYIKDNVAADRIHALVASFTIIHHIKILPHLRTSMHRMWGNGRGFDLLER